MAYRHLSLPERTLVSQSERRLLLLNQSLSHRVSTRDGHANRISPAIEFCFRTEPDTGQILTMNWDIAANPTAGLPLFVRTVSETTMRGKKSTIAKRSRARCQASRLRWLHQGLRSSEV